MQHIEFCLCYMRSYFLYKCVCINTPPQWNYYDTEKKIHIYKYFPKYLHVNIKIYYKTKDTV